MNSGMRVRILGALITASLVAPAAAQAGIVRELQAADEVERQLEHRNPSFTYLATCRHVTSTRFTCSWSGFKNHAVADGRASVAKVSRYGYRARILSFRTSSF
jgi:hypothetical protein